MPTFYELMDAFRAWYREGNGAEPSPHYAVMSAAFASHLLKTYQFTTTPPTGETTP